MMQTRLFVAVVALGACGHETSQHHADAGLTADAAPAPATANVSVVSGFISPVSARVAMGGRVTWTNMDGVTHHLVSGEPGGPSIGVLFDSETILENGFVPFSSFSVTFEAAGTFAYHCVEHPIMRGTILVE
jgi:plastocyanin